MTTAKLSWLSAALLAILSALSAVAAEAPSHWAFQPVHRPDVPVVEGAGNPVDAFVVAEQRKQRLTLAPEAPRRVLIRRLSLDLIGLPPTPDEVATFENDPRPDAYERLVERLLASPHYGERWGRHWLDVARWAESEGYESNHPRPFAWRYRDYVVASFNADRPFDQFLTQQIAGDELSPYSDENLIATGFLAAARLSSNEEDRWLQRNQVLVDVVNATGSAFLGLTVQCAQCHNHKFDPISLRDYYALMAYFLPGQPANASLADPELRRAYEQRKPADLDATLTLKNGILEKARQVFVTRETAKLPAELREALEVPVDRRTPEEEVLARRATVKLQPSMGEVEKLISTEERPGYDALKKKIADGEKLATPPQTWAFYSPAQSPHRVRVLSSLGFYPLPYNPEELASLRCRVLQRGDVHDLGLIVNAGIPSVFARHWQPTTAAKPGSRRELAAWLTDPRHPLTARVWANHVWQYHFGRGLVATSGDFGTRGERPTHPELLDWLADELVRSGWSTKHLHRLIVTSRTYRQSSRVDLEVRRKDPANRHLTRWPIRRLEAEAIRDSFLAVTGELDRRRGGASDLVLDQVETSMRRSLYLFHKRGRPAELAGLFDGPNEAAESCPRRHVSTTPLQALFLLNHPFLLARAKTLAATLPADPDELIESVYRRVLGRTPEADEREACRKFLAEGGESESARVRLCHTILNLNEAVTLE
jgi:hypothetical protein